jgi:hypothetical protein
MPRASRVLHTHQHHVAFVRHTTNNTLPPSLPSETLQTQTQSTERNFSSFLTQNRIGNRSCEILGKHTPQHTLHKPSKPPPCFWHLFKQMFPCLPRPQSRILSHPPPKMKTPTINTHFPHRSPHLPFVHASFFMFNTRSTPSPTRFHLTTPFNILSSRPLHRAAATNGKHQKNKHKYNNLPSRQRHLHTQILHSTLLTLHTPHLHPPLYSISTSISSHNTHATFYNTICVRNSATGLSSQVLRCRDLAIQIHVPFVTNPWPSCYCSYC